MSKVIDELKLRFTSGNDIPVWRASITRDEFEALLAELQDLEQGKGLDVLPCDVRLPPNTLINKGCRLSTLLHALDLRVGEDVNFAAEAKQPALPRINSGDELIGDEMYWVRYKGSNYLRRCIIDDDGMWFYTGALLLNVERRIADKTIQIAGPIQKPEW